MLSFSSPVRMQVLRGAGLRQGGSECAEICRADEGGLAPGACVYSLPKDGIVVGHWARSVFACVCEEQKKEDLPQVRV